MYLLYEHVFVSVYNGRSNSKDKAEKIKIW